MNITSKELDNFMQKIKEREKLLYITVPDKYSDKKIKFSIKNSSTYFRGTTLFTKEPITIEWIRSFKKKSIFFDIGANIGVYSLYAALCSEAKVYSFEPESNNFQNLMENIIINKQEEKILAFPIGISNETVLTKLHLSEFSNASSHHTVGDHALNHNSLKEFDAKYKQGIFSTTIDSLIEKWNIPFPNYIKVDVDGIEHKIIESSDTIFQNKKLISLLIEINENRKEDQSIINKLKIYGFHYDKIQVEQARRKDGPHRGYAEYLFYR